MGDPLDAEDLLRRLGLAIKQINALEQQLAERDRTIARLSAELDERTLEIAHWKAECNQYVTLANGLNREIKKQTEQPLEACMKETHADNGRLQICALQKGHSNSHYSRAGWLWTDAIVAARSKETE